MIKKVSVIMMIFLLLGGSISAAERLDGEEVLRKLDQTLKTVSKFMSEEMILYTSSGSERSRTVEVWNKTEGNIDRMLVRFTAPADIAGTAFLMIEDDMWLYLPALGKVKRIAGSAKQGSFMGSDLTYEDMQAIGNTGFTKDYNAKFINETELDDKKAFHLELLPVNKEISYKKLEIWVDSDNYLPLKIEYYNKSNKLEKVLLTYGHKIVDGRWTAAKMAMENVIKGSKTELLVNEIDFTKEIDDRIFTTRYLERGK